MKLRQWLYLTTNFRRFMLWISLIAPGGSFASIGLT